MVKTGNLSRTADSHWTRVVLLVVVVTALLQFRQFSPSVSRVASVIDLLDSQQVGK